MSAPEIPAALLVDIARGGIPCDLFTGQSDPCPSIGAWTLTLHDCAAPDCAGHLVVCDTHKRSLAKYAERSALRPVKRPCGTRSKLFSDTLWNVEPLGRSREEAAAEWRHYLAMARR